MAKDNLTQRVAQLEQAVEGHDQRIVSLEKERPGRKPVPILVSEEGVCGVDPDRDSATCPDASIYRAQQKCKGTRCTKIYREYYADRRNDKRKEVKVEIDRAAAKTAKKKAARKTTKKG